MSKMKKFYLAALSFFPGTLFAQTQVGIPNPIRATTVQELIGDVLNAVIYFSIPVLGLALIFVGFQFVSARGNPGEIAKAKTNFWYTILGAAIVLGAKGLQLILSGTINQIIVN